VWEEKWRKREEEYDVQTDNPRNLGALYGVNETVEVSNDAGRGKRQSNLLEWFGWTVAE